MRHLGYAVRQVHGVCRQEVPASPFFSAPWCAGGVLCVVLCRSRGWLGGPCSRPRGSEAIVHPSALARETCEPCGPSSAPQPPARVGTQGPGPEVVGGGLPVGAALTGLHRWK